MPRYIDAEKLINHLKDEISECTPPIGDRAHGKSIAYGTAIGLKMAISFAETLPDEQVVPREEHEELIYKLECLLCCASGGKLSKHTYDLKTMETVVNDYINESYYDGAKDTAKEIFAEIRKIVTAIYNKHIFKSDSEDEEKEAVMDFEVDISSDFDELEEEYGITNTAPKE